MTNEENPLVTIITVTYNLVKLNRAKFLKQCMESIHNQTYKNIEHIVIDGDSKDGTVDLIRGYANKGWVKYISEPDTGIYDAMNKGIKMANGKYIAFLNSDDFYNNERGVEDSIRVLEEVDADFSYAPAKIEREDGIDLGGDHQYYSPEISKIFFTMAFCHQTMFTKKSVFIQEGMFDASFKSAGDYDFILRLCLNNYKSVFVNNKFITFRLGGFSGLDENRILTEVSRAYFKNFNKLVTIKKEECDRIFDRGFKGISIILASKLRNYEPYFNFNEYVDSFKIKNKIKNFILAGYKKIKIFFSFSDNKSVFNIIYPNIFIWLIITVLFSVIQINQSLHQGQLSLPPSYDDVSYFNDSLRRLDIFYNKGFTDLFINYANRPPHSPMSTLLAFLGFAIFGVKEWAPAFMNGIIVFLVLIFLDYLSRGLSLGHKIFIALVSLSWLLMGHAIIEFRPDIFCGLMTAMAIILITEKKFIDSSPMRQKITGIIFGLALFIKPTLFPVTIILIFTALGMSVLTDRILLKNKISLKRIFFKSRVFFIFSFLIATPYYLFGWRETVKYIYQNQFIDLEKVWGMHSLPFMERISYYAFGQGGLMMMKNWIYLWMLLFIISLIVLFFKKNWNNLNRLPSLIITAVIAFVIISISNHKSPFLGVIFSCLIFFSGMQMIIFILRNSQKKFIKIFIISLSILSIYTFEWPAPNDLVSPNPKTLSERKYYNNLLSNIYNDISSDNNLHKKESKIKEIPKKIYLSSLSHWLHLDSLTYYQIKLGGGNFIISDGALKDDKNIQIKEITNSDYVIAFSTPSQDTPDWLPSVRIEKEIVILLDESADFKLINTYTNPYTGAKVFLYSKKDK